MEIIDNNSSENGCRRSNLDKMLDSKNIYIGVVMIFAGVLWLMYNLDIISYMAFDLFFSWEMLLIAIGGYFLSLRKWIVGGVITLVGFMFMLTNYLNFNIPVGKIILPIALISAGVIILASIKRKKE